MSSFFGSKKGSSPTSSNPNKKTGSMSLRAKKFMASKAADSSAGRRTIVKFFGTEGEEIVKAFTTGLELTSGPSVAQSTMKDILKLAGKVGLLMADGTVGEENFKGAMPHVFEVAMGMIEGMDTAGEAEGCVERVADNLIKAGDEVYEVVRTYMQGKNSMKLKAVAGVLADPDYLSALMSRRDLEGPRQILRDNIAGFMESNQGMRRMNEFLTGERMRRRGKLRALLLKPTFGGYMRDPETRSRVMEWVVSEGEACLWATEFYQGVGNLRTVENKKTRRTRGEMLYYRYLVEGCGKPVFGEGEEVEEIARVGEIFGGDGVVGRDVFDGLLKVVAARLGGLFLGTGVNKHSFVSSEWFKAMEEELRAVERKLGVGDRGRRISKVTEGFWEDGEGEEDDDEGEAGGEVGKAS
ncbi:hypothetical protein TrCOL_g8973 [Triparma columacea]|uniref:Uncharacterized protein n=1 Tax=Triparma columacea TaxID=722753 RepID=A0A9W7L4R4_9STRA|nr:hypothetical protein TrCOL_g8973 [Triparma columacea]